MHSKTHSSNTRVSFKTLINPEGDSFWNGASLISGLGALYFVLALEPPLDAGLVKTSMITSGTLLGFLLTSLSVLLGLSGKKVLDGLKKSGHFENLVDHTFKTALLLALGILAGLIFLISPDAIIAYAISPAVLFVALIQFLRIGYKFKLIFWIVIG
jgi:hypothetical protein